MTTISKIQQEGKCSYELLVTTKDDKFKIPVVDVRDGDQAREKANAILKSSKVTSNSKHMRPTFAQGGGCYQVSRK